MELKELQDVVHKVAAVDYGCEDGAEIVIEQLDVASLLSSVFPRETHRDTHVRFLDSWSVVRAISNVSNSLVNVGQVMDYLRFGFRGASRCDNELRCNGFSVTIIDIIHACILIFKILFRGYSCIDRHLSSSLYIVTSGYANIDAHLILEYIDSFFNAGS